MFNFIFDWWKGDSSNTVADASFARILVKSEIADRGVKLNLRVTYPHPDWGPGKYSVREHPFVDEEYMGWGSKRGLQLSSLCSARGVVSISQRNKIPRN
jgi:hypothetical protein